MQMNGVSNLSGTASFIKKMEPEAGSIEILTKTKKKIMHRDLSKMNKKTIFHRRRVLYTGWPKSSGGFFKVKILLEISVFFQTINKTMKAYNITVMLYAFIVVMSLLVSTIAQRTSAYTFTYSCQSRRLYEANLWFMSVHIRLSSVC